MSVPVDHVQSGVYDLSAGVYLLSNSTRNAIHYLKLPRNSTDEIKWEMLEVNNSIIDIGLCLYEHDLIVIVTSYVSPPLFLPPLSVLIGSHVGLLFSNNMRR